GTAGPGLSGSKVPGLSESKGLVMSESKGLVLSESKGLGVSESKGLVLSESKGLVLSESKGLVLSESKGLALSESKGHMLERTRWAIVVGFAIAMAWVEAASVFYIRALVDRIEPYQADPLPMDGALAYVELWREAATLVIIATLGTLAGRTRLRRAGYA